MKILFFIERLGSGGKERRLVELIKRLSAKKNVEMELALTRDNIHYKDIFTTGIKIHYLTRGKKINDLNIFFLFYRIAKIFKPDIIHVWGNLVAIFAIPSKIILQAPMINNQITNAPLKVSNSLFSHRLTFLFSDRIISNTFEGLKVYNVSKYKSSMIYNGFDFERIRNLNDKIIIRKKFDIKTKYIVGMVSNFTNKKDYSSFIKAADEVLKGNQNVTFLCVGGGDYIRYKQLIDHENTNNILFLGKQENVEDIMNICDIGVLMSNSKVHGEGISNALLEFMALGKPVIANNAGGSKELIINNRNGFLINDEDYIDLKNKILYLLKNDSLNRKFGDESRKIVEEKFDIEKMVDSFMMEYNKILAKKYN